MVGVNSVQWDTQICVRTSTETAGSPCNSEIRRTPSYISPIVDSLGNLSNMAYVKIYILKSSVSDPDLFQTGLPDPLHLDMDPDPFFRQTDPRILIRGSWSGSVSKFIGFETLLKNINLIRKVELSIGAVNLVACTGGLVQGITSQLDHTLKNKINL